MDVRAYVEPNAREFIDDLKQWLAIPSISAGPARHADVRRSAGWLAGHLRGAGFPVAGAGAEVSAYLWEELASIGADLR